MVLKSNKGKFTRRWDPPEEAGLKRFYLKFLLGEGGEVDPKEILEQCRVRKNFTPFRGFREHAPLENFGKIVFRIG